MTKFPLIADESVGFIYAGHYGALSGTGLRPIVRATRIAKNAVIQNVIKKPAISAQRPAMNGRMVIPR